MQTAETRTPEERKKTERTQREEFSGEGKQEKIPSSVRGKAMDGEGKRPSGVEEGGGQSEECTDGKNEAQVSAGNRKNEAQVSAGNGINEAGASAGSGEKAAEASTGSGKKKDGTAGKKRKKEKPAMEVRSLSFAYGKNRVLRNISLKIEKGKITTIMGANGCGKSTLFSLMTKNLEPGKGNIFLGGRNIQNLTLKEFAQRVSIVQQYNTSSDDITVEQLVSFGRTPHRKPMQAKTDEDDRLIDWAIEVTNLQKFRHREVSRLSGGQRQRVWIAMALAQNTKILFLDEPTTYLDIRYQIEILELVKKLNREFGITIIMVLHDINQAIYFSDRVIGLKGGHIVVEGNPDAVITSESLKTLYDIDLDVTRVQGQKFVLTV